MYLEGRIFFRQLLQRNAHLFLVGFRLGFHRNGNNRFREHHGFQNDRSLFITQRVAGRRKLQANRCCDISGVRFRDFFPVIGMHQQDAAHTFAFLFGRVVNIGTCGDHAGVNPEEAKLANEGVGRDFECQCREGLAVRSRPGIFLAGFRIDTLNALDIRRSRHVIHNRVQQGLNAFILIGRTAEHRIQFAFDGFFADCRFQLFVGDFFAFQIFHHQLIITFGNGFYQNAAVFFSLFLHVGRNFNELFFLTHIVAIDDRFHPDQVNHALELIFTADGDLKGNRICIQPVAHHIHNMEEVSADDVHLIYVCHTRYFVLVSLTPYGFRLGFNAALGRKYCNRSVQYTQGTFNLNREVNVARGINDVDTVRIILLFGTVPHAGRCSGSNGNATFLLLNHPVHGGRAIMNLTDLMSLTGVEQDAFRGSRFTGVNVCHDADISCSFKRN